MSDIDLLLNDNSDPFAIFSDWLSQAGKKELDSNAMTLATVDKKGRITARMVLLKGHDMRGFVFYTNAKSDKGRALKENPKASLLFHWKSLRRQVRIEGGVEDVSKEEADAYFASRPRSNQIGAWASQQSSPLKTRMAFISQIAAYTKKFTLAEVPRPPHWRGYRVAPVRMEFWQDRVFRLHDRAILTRQSTKSVRWKRKRLYP